MRIIWRSRDHDLRQPAALIAFAGWGDAGRAATGAARHLVDTYPSSIVAEIPSDEFFDFTVRRPFTYLEDNVRKIRWPETRIHVVHHLGRDLVVVIGEEPHLRWQLFTEILAEALTELGVAEAVLLGAFLGEVPHTRSTPIFGAGSNPLLLEQHRLTSTNYQGPTGIVGVLTSVLGRPEFPAMALWGAVPHYLEDPEYPPATYALVSKAAEVLRINVAAGDLAARALELRIALDNEISDQPDLQTHVRNLEAMFPEEEAQGTLVDEIERFLQERG
jgi:proteasome assembly chaperone (PAC2) family protein